MCTKQRGPGYRARTKSLLQLSNILFECYQVVGPVYLLDAVVELSRAALMQVVICDVSLVPAATGHMCDVLYAFSELHYDLEALQSSIVGYRYLLDGTLSSSSAERSYWTAQLARAMIRRFKTSSNTDDCQSALNLLESQAAAISSDDQLAHAWITMTTIAELNYGPAS
jgi:hypothetical protein